MYHLNPKKIKLSSKIIKVVYFNLKYEFTHV